MNVEIINAVVNERDQLEVVKELTDDEGNVAYELHIIPKNAIVNNAALMNIDNPDDAMDVVLYSPYVGTEDQGEHPVVRVHKAKERLKSKGLKNKDARQNNLNNAGVHERYHPIEGIDPIDIIRAHGGVTTERLESAKERLHKKEKNNDDARREQRPSESRREESRRAHISLGTTD